MDSRHQYPGANREADREKLDATGTSIFCNDEVVSEEIGRDTRAEKWKDVIDNINDVLNG
jgi:hypothetical protein